MPCKKKYKAIKAVDVGKPKGHYIRVGIKKKRTGKRRGKSEKIGRLRKYKKPKGKKR